jgi:hypothetical protein
MKRDKLLVQLTMAFYYEYEPWSEDQQLVVFFYPKDVELESSIPGWYSSGKLVGVYTGSTQARKARRLIRDSADRGYVVVRDDETDCSDLTKFFGFVKDKLFVDVQTS